MGGSKMVSILFSLVDEAYQESNEKIEADIRRDLDDRGLPWAKSLVKVTISEAEETEEAEEESKAEEE